MYLQYYKSLPAYEEMSVLEVDGNFFRHLIAL